MQGDVQHPFILRLPNQGIVSSLRNWERFVVRPRPLHELETILQARLIAREEEATRVLGIGLGGSGVVFGAVGDPVANHAGHFHGVRVCPGVHFADVGAEGAIVFGDAFVAEGII